MKWFRKSLMWASIGYFGATASGQEIVTLGRPTPLPGGASEIRVVTGFVPIQPRPTVVRASGFMLVDDPKNLILPPDLPRLPPPLPAALGADDVATKPAQSLQPPAKEKATIVPIEKEKDKAEPGKASPSGPAAETIVVLPARRDSAIFDWSVGGADRVYARAEYLLWWTRGMHLPPLLTTAAATDPEVTRGVPGFDNTRLLFGNSITSAGPTSGARFTLGYNLDECGLWALEGNYFFLGRKNDNAFFDSNQFPVLARPFFNVNLGRPDAELIATPGILGTDLFKSTGTFTVNSSSTLQGAELNLRGLLWVGCDYRITGLVGARYLNLNENLDLIENINVLKAPPGSGVNPGDKITVFDFFHTRNQFFGGQIGLSGEWQSGRWFLEANAKLALGSTHQTVDIDGGQTIVGPAGLRTARGGLYALPSNIGHFSQSRFGVVPEVGLKVGYNLTDNVRIFVGYDFLYWSSVLRPGDQIDESLNVSQVPGRGQFVPPSNQVRPIVPFRTSSYWATGINAGIAFRY